MPEPSCVRPRAPSTRWKRSKSRGSSAAAMPMPVSRTVSSALPAFSRKTTSMPPSKVNLKAFERRFRTIFSHMPRSTYTGCGSGGQSTSSRRPAFSHAVLKLLASSAVNLARSVGA